MQFPTGKKERIEIAVIACIVAIGALFGLITFVIMPFRDSYRTCLQDINTLQTNLDAANSEIANIRSKSLSSSDLLGGLLVPVFMEACGVGICRNAVSNLSLAILSGERCPFA